MFIILERALHSFPCRDIGVRTKVKTVIGNLLLDTQRTFRCIEFKWTLRIAVFFQALLNLRLYRPAPRIEISFFAPGAINRFARHANNKHFGDRRIKRPIAGIAHNKAIIAVEYDNTFVYGLQKIPQQRLRIKTLLCHALTTILHGGTSMLLHEYLYF